MMRDRLTYLFASAAKRMSKIGLACPSCGSKKSMPVSGKYLVTELRRCGDCHLMFRTPTDTAGESFDYYQQSYNSGFTTELPSEAALADMLESGFSRTPKDFNRYVKILRALGIPEGARVVDFGCSWGYGVWQFARAGFYAHGYELSVPRASFAREKLAVNVVSDAEQLPFKVDVVFTSHVLEHIPQLKDTLELIFSMLRPGGLMVAITPNGSDAYRAGHPDSWQRSWGLKHPLLLDVEYWRSSLVSKSYLVTSKLTDVSELRKWREKRVSRLGPLEGPELLAVVSD